MKPRTLERTVWRQVWDYLARGTVLVLLISIQVEVAFGQALPPATDPKGLFGQPPPVTKETIPPSPLPLAPDLLPPVTPPLKKAPGRLPTIRVFVKEIEVRGSTVFSPEQLADITAPYVGKEVSTEDLEELRLALTRLFVSHGYVNSGAVIPDQTVTDGILTIHIIEGELTDIEIQGLQFFLPFYLQSRLRLSAGQPLNVKPLQERLQLLLQDPRLKRINAELKPGLRPGESVLAVQVQESNPFKAWVEFNNFQSPTVGAERVLATIANENFFGLGDPVRFTYGRSEGVDPLIDVSYALPVTPWDTQLGFQYRYNDFEVVESPFDDLNIETNTEIYTLSIRHPVILTTTREISFSVIGEHLKTSNFLLGIPFSFTPGTTSKGEARISSLRLGQEWVERRPSRVLAARSRFSIGLDVLNATINDGPVADGQFFSWLGQIQAAQRIDPWAIQIIGRMDFQVANDRLFPLEQYAIGGRYSVRGYRTNQLVRDNAFLFSLESRIPIFQSALKGDSVQLAPFIDVGHSWRAKDLPSDRAALERSETKTLASIGLGLLTSFFQGRVQGNVYWGQPLNHVSTPEGNPQDLGFYFQLWVNLL